MDQVNQGRGGPQVLKVRVMDDPRAESIITFWFGARDGPEFGRKRARWFKKDPIFDQTIRDDFMDLYQQAVDGGLDAWKETPDGALALLILLDQFPRNMFRNEARAFATDAMALKLAKEALEQGFHQRFHPSVRTFFFLPFEHSEDLVDQVRSIELFKEAGDREGLLWAVKHLEIIRRFGRFPHRNQALGRVDTPEEKAFLQEPDASF